MIFGTPEEENNEALGFFKCENAWYRKSFTLDKGDEGKRLSLLFEGIATHSTVYLNGCLLKRNFCGYNSFSVDISDYVKFGKPNILAVYVQMYGHEGWWYEGGGIYRHVWLEKTDTVAVDLWGVYAAPEKVSEDVWNVNIEVTVRNDRYTDERAEVTSYIIDKHGRTVSLASGEIEIPKRDTAVAKYSARVASPVLWDIDSPNLYTVNTTVKINGAEIDTYKTRIGFRSFSFDKDEGLFLNGRHVKIKGVCAHQDFGLTGKAVPDNIHRHKIELIKEMGANGYRTSHYPHSEATMDALDELGFIVMNETRWFESSEDGIEQLKMLVKRDRNRPSVLFWSVGNEEPYHITEEGRRISQTMTAEVRKLDKTRYVMTAVSHEPDISTVYDELDAIGINYNLDKYDAVHEKYPDKPIFASECCATGTTRGWYFDDFPEKSFYSAYDKDTNAWFLGREKTWKFITERKWILGEYQWIAFEHRGEATWPRLCSQSGAIDLYLQKKDAFYQNQSHWIEDKPVLHLLPHWNFKGIEGEPIRVVAYTSCEEVELFLNGKSVGICAVPKYGHAEWQVPYVRGEIRAEGRIGGATVITDTQRTTGAPVRLTLKLENKITRANGADIALITCSCADSEGYEVPDAEAFVKFNTNKLGKIVGTGSDITDRIPPYRTERKMRAGKISVAVKLGSTVGELKVYAHAEGLDGAVITVPLTEA